jgi:hypothetical protein
MHIKNKDTEVERSADVTIEIEKREKGEEFKFEDLLMYHQDCYGGKIKIEVIKKQEDLSQRHYNLFKLICVRCGREIYLDKDSNSPADVIKTSVDGKEREIDGIQIETTHSTYTSFHHLKILVKLRSKS